MIPRLQTVSQRLLWIAQMFGQLHDPHAFQQWMATHHASHVGISWREVERSQSADRSGGALGGRDTHPLDRAVFQAHTSSLGPWRCRCVAGPSDPSPQTGVVLTSLVYAKDTTPVAPMDPLPAPASAPPHVDDREELLGQIRALTVDGTARELRVAELEQRVASLKDAQRSLVEQELVVARVRLLRNRERAQVRERA
ncbi:hypothetical protein GOP47_0013725 [Adiantum capillus-veneris]|uniref:Uncharacterized protein n=1 Tax=Adiantum capillus-veneris TaxID=13818 RepID=A0A9D4UPK7_ADICA|nr:hypothetical protein GOP47_0013725 [Adiantum capillus-veneris]